VNPEPSPSQTKDLTWSWLKSISRELYALDSAPLLGHAPQFPWQACSAQVAKCFGIEHCTISAGDLAWKEANEMVKGLHEPLLCIQLGATGVNGELSFWVSQTDIQSLMGVILNLSPAVLIEQKPDILDAFYQFLSLQTVAIVNQLDFDKRISYKILSYEKLAPSQALCQDVVIAIDSQKILARVVISNEFRTSWASIFSQPHPQGSLHLSLDDIPTTIRVEAGRTTLTMKELLEVNPGDFITLDHVFFSPGDDKSRLLLTLEGKPLLRAKLKQGNLKILENPLYHEVYDSMVDNLKPTVPEATPNKQPLDHTEEDPFADEEDLDLENEEFTAEEAAPHEQPPVAAAAPTFMPSGPLTTNDLAITVVVELAQITLSAQKLIELQPGNLLDLNIVPEHGVSLVVNGKIIGRGEILKIGESIGVRVLQIGV
jgi:flagellar motor switch protein FliN/FliY